MPSLQKKIRSSIIHPIRAFLEDSRATGIILFCCTILSMIITNTNVGKGYLDFWNSSVNIPGPLHFPHTVLHWINDGLMAIFFFLVGMEIKRELVAGELSSFQKAILPVMAALGGMIVPAAIFSFFNVNTNFAAGWGIPMATDIAFSLGVASLLGKRMPVSLKIFLMALAIIDDLGAIVVIALFYGGDIQWIYLGIAVFIFSLVTLINYFKKGSGWLFIIAGIALWYCVFQSGIHATIAGVLTALLIPTDKLPAYEHRFHNGVNFIILPLFALANTAILLPGNLMEVINSSLSWGIVLGLVIGKPLGITSFSWLAVKTKLGAQPSDVSWLQMLGAGLLAGIGFTMSIFIAMLAFTENEFHDVSKIAVLIASLLSMLVGLLLLSLISPRKL